MRDAIDSFATYHRQQRRCRWRSEGLQWTWKSKQRNMQIAKYLPLNGLNIRPHYPRYKAIFRFVLTSLKIQTLPVWIKQKWNLKKYKMPSKNNQGDNNRSISRVRNFPTQPISHWPNTMTWLFRSKPKIGWTFSRWMIRQTESKPCRHTNT